MPFNRAVAVDENYNLPGPVLAKLREELRIQRTSTVIVSSGAMSPGGQQLGVINLGDEFQLISVQMSHKSRIRLYSDMVKRNDDLARAVGTDPEENHGVILDVLMTSTDTLSLSPQVIGATALPDQDIYYTLDNVETSPAVITVTLVSRRLD